MLVLRCQFLLCVAIALFLTTACSRSGSPVASSSGGGTPGDSSEGVGAEDQVEVLLEPFDPPPLDELEADIEWEDQGVVDPLEDRLAAESDEKPLVSVQQALQLRNDGAESNRKILSALGRLPESEGDVDWDAKIVRHTSGDVKSTNPLMISSVAEFDVLGLTGVEIFGFDERMEPLALGTTVRSWQTSSNGLYDKLILRDDMTWSDGKPITAHDIVFSFQTIMNPKVPVPAVRAGTDQLKWVHAYGDQTVVYFHKKASPTNIWNVNFPVIPKHVYEESVDEDPTMQNSDYHVAQEANPVSGGAYVLTKRVRAQELVLERREDYFFHEGKQVRPMRHFKEIRFRVIEDPNTSLLALRAGEIEETQITAEQWMTDQTNNDEFYERNTKATGVQWVGFHVNWNVETPFFSDKRVRWAMAYAFDHEEMLDKLFYGLYEPSSGPFHRTAWMAPQNYPQPIEQDLDKAEDLLDEAGWDDSDGDGFRDKEVDGKLVPFEFSILCSQTPNSVKVCELFKQNLGDIGITCHVKPMEFTVLQQNELDHKFHAAFGGWGTGTDPDTTINIFGSGENRNFGLFSNKEVDDLFEQGRNEFDREKRGAIYARLHEILWEEQPYMWLFWRNSFYGFNKELRGYRFSPRGPYNYNPGFDAVWKPMAP